MRIVEWLRHRGRQARLESAVTTVRVIDILVPVIAEELIARIDVDALVRQHVDLEKLISSIPLDALVDQVDVDRVASRLDIDAVLDRIDLTAVVRDRLDVDAVVGAVDIDAVAARLDVDAVIERLDLPTIAQDVIDSIDLPVIIRESSGSMASEAVQGVRLHSIDADDAVHRALDRVLGHRRSASSKAPVPGVPPPDVEERVADPLTRPSP
ncbi:MAG TPA: hypothetical protein VIT41_16705 [Microlunatus sp.]